MDIIALDGFRIDVSTKTTWVVVRLRADDGTEGWGEATHFGAEAQITALLSGLADCVADTPASSLAALLAPLHQAAMGSARRALRSALEQGWHDIAARRAGLGLCAALGGPEREAVPFYANINRGIADRSPEGFAKRAAEVVAQTGAAAVKIAPFDGLHWSRCGPGEMARLTQAGLDRVAAVRVALPSGAWLMVDCHARFDAFHARGLFAALAEQDVYWVEEPCDMGALSSAEQRGLRSAANDRGLRLAGGETVAEVGEMARLLQGEGHDVVLPDLRLTGIAGGIAMLRLAAGLGVGASLHNPVGPVLDAVSVHLACALPSFLILERQVGETPLYDAMRGKPARVEGGTIRPETGPGLGIVPTGEALEPLGSGAAARLSFAGVAGAGPDA